MINRFWRFYLCIRQSCLLVNHVGIVDKKHINGSVSAISVFISRLGITVELFSINKLKIQLLMLKACLLYVVCDITDTYMHAYVHAHTHTHTNTHTQITHMLANTQSTHAHAHTHTHSLTHTPNTNHIQVETKYKFIHIDTCTNKQTQTHTHSHTHTRTHTKHKYHTQTQIYRYKLTPTDTCTNKQTQTHTHSHMHAHSHRHPYTSPIIKQLTISCMHAPILWHSDMNEWMF